MVCHCYSTEMHNQRAAESSASSARYEASRHELKIKELEAEIASLTPDNSHYEIVDAVAVGTHLVMRVKYQSCRDCAYEGIKVMVFLDTNSIDALKWRKIDPHFRTASGGTIAAPSPAARFPASPQGWMDALAYAKGK